VAGPRCPRRGVNGPWELQARRKPNDGYGYRTTSPTTAHTKWAGSTTTHGLTHTSMPLRRGRGGLGAVIRCCSSVRVADEAQPAAVRDGSPTMERSREQASGHGRGARCAGGPASKTLRLSSTGHGTRTLARTGLGPECPLWGAPVTGRRARRAVRADAVHATLDADFDTEGLARGSGW
jgi:hypothetical protein